MFTGIITSLGEVVAIEQRGDLRIAIAGDYDPGSVAIGASIACSGVCLTVVETGEQGGRGWFAVDAAAETNKITTAGRWNTRTRRGRRLKPRPKASETRFDSAARTTTFRAGNPLPSRWTTTSTHPRRSHRCTPGALPGGSTCSSEH